MLYFEKGIDAGHVRSARRGSAYTATYYDVRTGQWIERGTVEADEFGVLDLPAKPTEDDWALVLAVDG
jgi:glutamate mutase epsilon subunit